MKPEKILDRAIETDTIELRATDGDDKQKYCRGVGVVFDKETELWDGYFETIKSGAFDRCLKNNPEIKSFINHDPGCVLATTRSRPSLRIMVTDRGVEYETPIPNTTYGRDLVVNLEQRNIHGSSFSFSVNKDDLVIDGDGNYHRTIIDADIYEVGPVTNPAYHQTKAALRDRDNLMAELRDRTGDGEIRKPAASRDCENVGDLPTFEEVADAMSNNTEPESKSKAESERNKNADELRKLKIKILEL